MKRGASGLSGILAVDKPGGITSHDVVNRVRRMSGERRVGHAGTLDPLATGLVFIGVGAATRLSQYLTGHDKSYRARICFGVATDTDDGEGRALDAGAVSPAEARSLIAGIDPAAALAGVTGEQLQLPPAYSAIKKNGVTAYKAAREGKALDLEPRAVTVRSACFEGAGTGRVRIARADGGFLEAELPYWDVDLRVSKGTYIRAVARDLGRHLGCGAHLGALRRTGVAAFDVSRAHGLDELEALFAAGAEIPWCNPVEVLGYPSVPLDAAAQADVANGRALRLERSPGTGLVSCTAGGRLLGVYACDGRRCKPATVIPGGVAGVA